MRTLCYSCVCLLLQRWVCKLDLDAGCYALIPFTSGCHLKPREEEGGDPVSIMREEGGRSVFTDACRCVVCGVCVCVDCAWVYGLCVCVCVGVWVWCMAACVCMYVCVCV